MSTALALALALFNKKNLFVASQRNSYLSLLGAGAPRAVDLRGKTAGEVERQAWLLRSCLGRKASLLIKNRHETKRVSVQGTWTALTPQQAAAVAAFKV